MSSDHDPPQAAWRRRSELSDLLLSVRSRLIRPDADGHERSLRQQDVADLVGISVRYYASFERGEIDSPGVHLVEAIAGALRMSEAQRSALHVLALSHDPPMPARQAAASRGGRRWSRWRCANSSGGWSPRRPRSPTRCGPSWSATRP